MVDTAVRPKTRTYKMQDRTIQKLGLLGACAALAVLVWLIAWTHREDRLPVVESITAEEVIPADGHAHIVNVTTQYLGAKVRGIIEDDSLAVPLDPRIINVKGLGCNAISRRIDADDKFKVVARGSKADQYTLVFDAADDQIRVCRVTGRGESPEGAVFVQRIQ